MMRKGDMGYICVIDEADGVFTKDRNGEMHEESKKLLREMKKAINTNNLGNAVYIFLTNYPKQFEGPLKQRFTMIESDGPNSPEQFGQLLKQELGATGTNISDREYLRLGQEIYRYKKEYENSSSSSVIGNFLGSKEIIPVTGRSVKKIALPYVGVNNETLMPNQHALRSNAFENKVKLIRMMAQPPTYQDLMNSINTYMKELIHSNKECA